MIILKCFYGLLLSALQYNVQMFYFQVYMKVKGNYYNMFYADNNAYVFAWLNI